MCGTLKLMQIRMQKQMAEARRKREEKEIERLIAEDKTKKQESTNKNQKESK